MKYAELRCDNYVPWVRLQGAFGLIWTIAAEVSARGSQRTLQSPLIHHTELCKAHHTGVAGIEIAGIAKERCFTFIIHQEIDAYVYTIW